MLVVKFIRSKKSRKLNNYFCNSQKLKPAVRGQFSYNNLVPPGTTSSAKTKLSGQSSSAATILYQITSSRSLFHGRCCSCAAYFLFYTYLVFVLVLLLGRSRIELLSLASVYNFIKVVACHELFPVLVVTSSFTATAIVGKVNNGLCRFCEM